LQWQYPEDVNLVAEIWLQSDDPAVIVIFETENSLTLEKVRAYWGDVFSITTIPAITGEEGLELAKKMMGS